MLLLLLLFVINLNCTAKLKAAFQQAQALIMARSLAFSNGTVEKTAPFEI
jgi:hypothetical protein